MADPQRVDIPACARCGTPLRGVSRTFHSHFAVIHGLLIVDVREFLPLLLGSSITCLVAVGVVMPMFNRERCWRYTSDRREWWAS
jgi:hypothetical protein